MNQLTTTDDKTEDTEGLFTTEMLANYLKASPRHVHNLVNRKLIPVIKIGRLSRFDLDQVKIALKRLTIEAA